MATPVNAAADVSVPIASKLEPNSSSTSSASYASSVVSAPLNRHSEAAQSTDTEALTDHDDLEGARTVAVPRCSTWFAMDKINPIEKRMLPEFFVENGSKTAEIYLKYRNYMVHAYRQQPSLYLTATACRRNLAGDACAILRVHEFLTHWGLINFHVPPHAMPPVIHSTYALKTAQATAQTTANNGHQGPIAMLVAAKKENARRVDVPLPCEACGTAREAQDAFFELTSEAKKKLTSYGAATSVGSANFISNGANGKAGEGKEVIVGGFALRPGSGICDECFIRGAFPEGYDASDFVLCPTVARNLLAKTKWTEEETSLMLHAVSSTRTSRIKGAENEEDDGSCDWNYVASKVGSKTADECLLHFLEMPLLDQPVQTQKPRLGDSIQSLRPFATGAVLNAPVLDLAALVEHVEPLVAKAAAHAAIGAVKRLHTMQVAPTTSPQLETPVSMENNGSTGTAGVKVESIPTLSGPAKMRDSSFEGAAAAVANSAEVAGIGSTIKSEDIAVDGDVAMEDTSLSTATVASKEGDDDKSNAVSVSKEMIAVTEEAANATTIALLASRSQEIADNIANGPIKDLVNQLLENQLRHMELKMQQLAVLEQAIVAEKEQLAKEKYQLYVDRLAFSREKINGRSSQLGP
ncbi:hypothetical protein KXD40_009344 [Peronospora effusa]|uniref:Uncharacterized protein n=1 Tax=Peronospora effusa TaxID=542832 RepID=A0A3M6VAM1_9STRA|nr:hypothetical protein DD238_008245 [Peronospora effusa]RMX64065.1 hypothetical protein DD238_008243 [Peronospora effusa]RQM11836.1 hypothetical protein DD237_008481 [Peronospora effusa]UIZ28592.1 hypothetical protein KXD40_009344 [Peronospora effusa]CAI5729823.1 unnamed protein product [Peronospora effusa]